MRLCSTFYFLPAAAVRWSIRAVSPPPSSAQRTIEHGGIETNELNMTLMSHMTHHDLVWLIMTHMTHYDYSFYPLST